MSLKVAESQKEYVASNDTSIIEAYAAITGNRYAFRFGIYMDDTPVGFLIIGYDTDDYWDDAPAIAKGNYNLWRLMIDEHYQGKGYGKEAVRLALDFIRTLPCGRLITVGCRMSRRMLWPASFTVYLALQKPANMMGKK